MVCLGLMTVYGISGRAARYHVMLDDNNDDSDGE